MLEFKFKTFWECPVRATRAQNRLKVKSTSWRFLFPVFSSQFLRSLSSSFPPHRQFVTAVLPRFCEVSISRVVVFLVNFFCWISENSYVIFHISNYDTSHANDTFGPNNQVWMNDDATSNDRKPTNFYISINSNIP